MLSSSVCCLSFAILNTFEDKKGIIKILVTNSAIDINQIDVILFAIIVTSVYHERFAKGASRTFWSACY